MDDKLKFNLTAIAKISVSMLLIDIIYLSTIKGTWNTMVSNIQNKKMSIKMHYAAIVYILMIIGLWFLVFKDRYEDKSIKKGLNEDSLTYILKAGVLGLLVYGVFDFTNLAIFSNYNLLVGISDFIWGGILFALVTLITISLEPVF